MFKTSQKRAAAAALALSMSLGTAGELLQPNSAQAITSNQINQAVQAFRNTGCNLGFQGSSATISCPTQFIASLLNRELAASSLKLYHSKGHSFAQYKIGNQITATTQQISNIYYNPAGPNNLKVMPDNLNSRSITIEGTSDGFKLVTSFESSGTEFQVEDKYFGYWKDGAFPDLHWDNARVTANLALNRYMTLSNLTNIEVSGAWAARTGANVIPDSFMNNKIRENLNVVFQNYLPLINGLIRQQLQSLASRVPGGYGQNIGLSFGNGNVSISVPLTADASSQRTNQNLSQRLTLAKAYRIKDDEPITNTYKNMEESFSLNVMRGSTATAFKPSSRSNSPVHCAGAEVRVEDWDRVEVDANGVARIWVSVELYEGTSCSSNDLDGSSIGVRRNGTAAATPLLVVAPGETKTASVQVDNTAEGGDYGKITYTFSNSNR